MSSCSGEEHKLHTKSVLTVADSVAPGQCTLMHLNPKKKSNNLPTISKQGIALVLNSPEEQKQLK